MRAICWFGKNDVRTVSVSDPKIINPHDAIVKVTRTAICGSDLHLYNGYIPSMEKGDILGHEFMGEIIEVGSEVKKLKKGDRVVVPFTIACGRCFFCQKELWSLCDNTNPNARALEKLYGYSGSGLFGYSHLYGGYAGGQAEYVRVPFADIGPIKIPAGLSDEQVLFLSDIFPTGYLAVENCNLQPGETVAIWGCGPVGQFAIKSAWLLGAKRVIAIDQVPERLRLAATQGKAETIDFSQVDVFETLQEMTGGRGPMLVSMQSEWKLTEQALMRFTIAPRPFYSSPPIVCTFCAKQSMHVAKAALFPFPASTVDIWTKSLWVQHSQKG
jgi:threonine dehydrogenase-like Zn-dependent dehydrogenase